MKRFRNTNKHLAFLRKNFPLLSVPDLTIAFNRRFATNKTPGQIKSTLKKHKIRCGRTGTFEKNHTPWNTGTKGIVKPNSGNFTKGSIPPNLRPIGSERICNKNGFILIKVLEKNPYTGAPTRFKHKHVHTYEQHFGPVPDGFVVAFRDSDRLNCEPGNLMLITRKELLWLNQHGYKDMPEELRQSILALVQMEVQMFDRLKEMKGLP